MTARPYSPDWCNAETMAYLISMGESTFRMHVHAGNFPQGVEVGGKTLWDKYKVYEALAKSDHPDTVGPDMSDMLEAARGKAKKARREVA